MSTVNTDKWVVVTTPPPPRRNAATQAAVDYFWKLQMGQHVLIPKGESSTARSAAAALKKDTEGCVILRIRDEGDGVHVRASKLKDYPDDIKARIEAGEPIPEASATE